MGGQKGGPKPLASRPCLSRWVSPGHPADVLGIFLKFMCPSLSLASKSGVAPANQTKERSVHELFAGAFRNKSSIRESCLFSQGKPCREEHSMDQCRSRLKLSENFERHWSIRISGEIHMDQSLVHTFSWGNSHGPMVLKVLLKFPPTLVLVHGWLFPRKTTRIHKNGRNSCTFRFGPFFGLVCRDDSRAHAKGVMQPHAS